MNVTLTAMTQPLAEEMTFDNVGETGMRQLTIDQYILGHAHASSPTARNNYETAAALLAYLIKKKRWAPFELVSFAFEIETSRGVAQELLAHRAFNFQEFGKQYAVTPRFEKVILREQGKENAQSSIDQYFGELDQQVDDHVRDSSILYETLINAGIARDSAGFILTMNTQTIITMNGALLSWIHFLEQHCDLRAQPEIRDIAFEIRKVLAGKVPCVAEALDWV